MKLIMENWRRFVNEDFLPGSSSSPTKLITLLGQHSETVCNETNQQLLISALEYLPEEAVAAAIQAKFDIPDEMMPIIEIAIEMYKIDKSSNIVEIFQKALKVACANSIEDATGAAIDAAGSVLNTGLGALGLEESSDNCTKCKSSSSKNRCGKTFGGYKYSCGADGKMVKTKV